jgi:hypothetical protein
MEKLIELVASPSFPAAAIIALAGSILAALLAYLTARRSVYINSVTVERSKWIAELRGNLAVLSGHILNINQTLVFDRDFALSEKYNAHAQEIHRLTSLGETATQSLQ